jgi:hypothetical protein
MAGAGASGATGAAASAITGAGGGTGIGLGNNGGVAVMIGRDPYRQGTIRNMPNVTETTHYYVRGTNPTNNEQVAFECVGLAVANAKAAELRMGGYRDVILSLVKASEAHDPTS